MAFSKSLKGMVVNTTFPYTHGEAYHGKVINVSVEGTAEEAIVTIAIDVNKHKTLTRSGYLNNRVITKGDIKREVPSLLNRIADELSEEKVRDDTFNVVEYLEHLENSTYTEAPEYITVYTYIDEYNKVTPYFSKAAYERRRIAEANAAVKAAKEAAAEAAVDML